MQEVLHKIGIPFYVLNFKEVFKEKVIDYFIDEYLQGRTPNPCIACNKHIKFDDFYKRARPIGCDYVATGHYAKIEKDEETGKYLLNKSVTDKKRPNLRFIQSNTRTIRAYFTSNWKL